MVDFTIEICQRFRPINIGEIKLLMENKYMSNHLTLIFCEKDHADVVEHMTYETWLLQVCRFSDLPPPPSA